MESNFRYIKEITAQEQFVVGKYYAILDAATKKQVDTFLCNNAEASAKKLDFYKGRCWIVENLTNAEILKAMQDLQHRNSEAYWRFVLAGHSRSAAPLAECVELQRELGIFENWLNSRYEMSVTKQRKAVKI